MTEAQLLQGSWSAFCMQAPALPAPRFPLDRPEPGQLQLLGHVPPHEDLQICALPVG